MSHFVVCSCVMGGYAARLPLLSSWCVRGDQDMGGFGTTAGHLASKNFSTRGRVSISRPSFSSMATRITAATTAAAFTPASQAGCSRKRTRNGWCLCCGILPPRTLRRCHTPSSRQCATPRRLLAFASSPLRGTLPAANHSGWMQTISSWVRFVRVSLLLHLRSIARARVRHRPFRRLLIVPFAVCSQWTSSPK
jgi:hypothetical protein